MENQATAAEAMNLLKNASSTLESLVGKLKGGARRIRKRRGRRTKRRRKSRKGRKSRKRNRTRRRRRRRR